MEKKIEVPKCAIKYDNDQYIRDLMFEISTGLTKVYIDNGKVFEPVLVRSERDRVLDNIDYAISDLLEQEKYILSPIKTLKIAKYILKLEKMKKKVLNTKSFDTFLNGDEGFNGAVDVMRYELSTIFDRESYNETKRLK